jgi:sucrose-6-phosphate hydrolase SacC (GH32 family)
LSLVGNWTTTIQANIKDFPPLSVGDPLRPEHLAAVNSKVDVAANSSGSLRTTFWTSKNFVDWSFVGVLTCPACDLCVQSCSDFYQIPAAAAAAATISSTGGGETVVASNRWVFGINTGGCGLRSGGMITGTFDRASLTLTPDRPEWAAAVLAGDRKAAQHWAYLLRPIHESNANGITCLPNPSVCPCILYLDLLPVWTFRDTLVARSRYDYGPFSFPKLSVQDGRRIIYAWLNINPGKQSDWIGMQSVPRCAHSKRVF